MSAERANRSDMPTLADKNEFRSPVRDVRRGFAPASIVAGIVRVDFTRSRTKRDRSHDVRVTPKQMEKSFH